MTFLEQNESAATMNVTVNGEPLTLSGDSHTISSVLVSLEALPDQVAVMLNEDIIETGDYGHTSLSEGDTMEVMMLVGGGSVASDKPLTLAGHTFQSRLILGTGKFSSVDLMLESITQSGSQLVTVALKRFNRERNEDDLYQPLRSLEQVTIMPNTSGARTATEAVNAARLGRELTGSPFVKVEIHPNPHHLMPDPIETYEACKVLAADDFVVMPYMPADPVLAKRLEDVGCASVMPLGSAIGSGQGLATQHALELIVRDSSIPVIVDAGLRSPSDAAAAMELGCDAVLVNSAIAVAREPAAMSRAFNKAVLAGREAHLAGLMSQGSSASASSPLTSFLHASQDET